MTPDEIREFQKTEPYPDYDSIWQTEYDRQTNYIINNLSKFDHVEDIGGYAKNKADECVRKFRQTQTTLSWAKTRQLVYVRDDGICDICQTQIAPEQYDCGHIIDRVCGGSDRLDNLVCMCCACNQLLKPLHDTKEQYEEWKRGQILPPSPLLGDIIALLKEHPELVDKLQA